MKVELAASHRTHQLIAAGGALLVLVALWWLFAIESTQQARVAALDAMGGPVLDVGTVTAAAKDVEGALVRVSGIPVVTQPVRDPQFGVVADTPVLERNVEMLQWREVDTGLGPPRYVRGWFDHAIDSADFAEPARHTNPGSFSFTAKRFAAADVRLAGLKLAPALVEAIPGEKRFAPNFSTFPANLTASFQLNDGALYTSRDPRSPVLGDLRVAWTSVPQRVLTVLARVNHGTLVPAPGLPEPGFVLLVDDIALNGVLPGLPNGPAAIWLQRALTLVLAWGGIMLVQFGLRRRLDPLTALAIAVVPLALTAATAWLGTRWLITLALAVVAVAAAAWAWYRWRSAPTTAA